MKRTASGDVIFFAERTHLKIKWQPAGCRRPYGYQGILRREDAFTWHPKCPRPEWPDSDVEWTPEDCRSAISIQTLNYDCSGHEYLWPIEEDYVRCSMAIQALNLTDAYGDFDDIDFFEEPGWKQLPSHVKEWFRLLAFETRFANRFEAYLRTGNRFIPTFRIANFRAPSNELRTYRSNVCFGPAMIVLYGSMNEEARVTVGTSRIYRRPPADASRQKATVFLMLLADSRCMAGCSRCMAVCY